MNKNKLSFLVLLFTFLANAGVLHSQELQTIQKLGLGINGLDLAVEIPLAENITIEPAVGLGPSYNFWEDEIIMGRTGFGWALLEPSVHASVHGKFFYNRDKRRQKGKSMLLNSGKFIGVKIKYVSKPLTDYKYHGKANTLIANLNWGGQRNIGKHWNYSYFLGVSYGRNLDSSYGTFYPGIDLKVAYVLPLFR
ncbi:MAG: hypothetical protein GX857_07625 [Bacteroidales bacterium]|jgi:hypothetical protein|nr:hypothetical protein [Bacteroidales bacterium]